MIISTELLAQLHHIKDKKHDAIVSVTATCIAATVDTIYYFVYVSVFF